MTKKLWYAIGFVVLLALPQVLPGELSWLVLLLNRALIFGIVAVGLNMLTGNAGQISMGHAGFIAVGAFASYGLTDLVGIPFWFAVPIAGLISALVGYGLGFPALRLSGHYLAIATLGFGVAIPQVLNLFETLSGGWTGVKPSAPYFYGISFRQDRPYFYLILFSLVFLSWVANNIVKSRTGRAFIALRDSEVAAQAMGISLTVYKTVAFAISAFYAGVGGALWAHMMNYISPHDFNLGMSIELFTIIVLGGLASIPGSIVGAVFMSFLPKVTEKVSLALQKSGAFSDSFFIQNMFKNSTGVLWGIILVLVVLYLPNGLVDLWRRALGWFGGRSHKAAAKGVK